MSWRRYIWEIWEAKVYGCRRIVFLARNDMGRAFRDRRITALSNGAGTNEEVFLFYVHYYNVHERHTVTKQRFRDYIGHSKLGLALDSSSFQNHCPILHERDEAI